MTFEKVLLDGPTRSTSTSSSRSSGSSSTPRAPASTGCATPPTCSPPWSPTPRPTSPPSSATAWSTTSWAGGARRRHERPRLPRRWPRRSATRPTSRSGSASSAASTALDRLVDGDAREAPPRPGPRPRSARPSTASATRPAAGDSDRDRALRGVLFEALGTLGDDADVARPGPRRCSTPAAPAPVDPEPRRRRGQRRRGHGGTEADFDEFVARIQAADDPAGGAALPRRPRRLRRPRARCDRLLAMSITDEVRTQNAPLPAAPGAHQPRPRRAGLVLRDRPSGTRSTSGSRPTPSSGCSKASGRCRRRRWRRRCSSFFEDHEVPQGDKILAQHLERLEVNVALRAREAEALAAELPGRSVNARHTPRLARMEIWPGEPFPLGATYDGSGSNFSLFSEVAERVELCLFDDDGTETRVDAARGHRLRPPRLPARRPARPALRLPGARPVGPAERALGATPPSCCSTPTPRRSTARSSGPRPSSPYPFDDGPDGPPDRLRLAGRSSRSRSW